MNYINTKGESALAQGVSKATSKVHTIVTSQSKKTKLD